MPVFVDLMMDNPGEDQGAPHYPVVEAPGVLASDFDAHLLHVSLMATGPQVNAPTWERKMSSANDSIMDGDITWGEMGQSAHEALSENILGSPSAQEAGVGSIVGLLGKLRKEIDDSMERLSAMREAAEQASASDDGATSDDDDEDVTLSSSTDELTLEDACIIGGGVLAIGGLAYMAYRALSR